MTAIAALPRRFVLGILLAVAAIIQNGFAGEVRLSFLNYPSSLTNTLSIVTNNGCAEDAFMKFRRVTEKFYEEPCEFDTSRLSKSDEDGFFKFESMEALIQALPQKLHKASHSYGFNCFDTVILLAGDNLRIALGPDDTYGPFVVSKQLTNGSETIQLAATPRDAFSTSYADWYRSQTESIFPKAMQEARIGLVAEIFRWHKIPMSTTDATVQEQAWKVLKSDWRRTGLKYPDRFQVVLYHMVSLDLHTINTPHAGLLFTRKSGFTYLEKAGGTGPFVRLDFTDKSELKAWMANVFADVQQRNVFLLATLNDTEIVGLNLK